MGLRDNAANMISAIRGKHCQEVEKNCPTSNTVNKPPVTWLPVRAVVWAACTQAGARRRNKMEQYVPHAPAAVRTTEGTDLVQRGARRHCHPNQGRARRCWPDECDTRTQRLTSAATMRVYRWWYQSSDCCVQKNKRHLKTSACAWTDVSPLSKQNPIWRQRLYLIPDSKTCTSAPRRRKLPKASFSHSLHRQAYTNDSAANILAPTSRLASVKNWKALR